MCQRLSGVRLLHTGHLLGSALGDKLAAVLSAFRAKIDDPVRVTNYVKVVFDDDDRVAQIGETVQDFEKLFHVFEVQSGGRLVEEIERLTGLALAQFASELDALRFAAG